VAGRRALDCTEATCSFAAASSGRHGRRSRNTVRKAHRTHCIPRVPFMAHLAVGQTLPIGRIIRMFMFSVKVMRGESLWRRHEFGDKLREDCGEVWRTFNERPALSPVRS